MEDVQCGMGCMSVSCRGGFLVWVDLEEGNVGVWRCKGFNC